MRCCIIQVVHALVNLKTDMNANAVERKRDMVEMKERLHKIEDAHNRSSQAMSDVYAWLATTGSMLETALRTLQNCCMPSRGSRRSTAPQADPPTQASTLLDCISELVGVRMRVNAMYFLF